MSKPIETALRDYLQAVKREFREGTQEANSTKSVRLLLTEDQLLLRLVERVEQRREFRELFRLTTPEFFPQAYANSGELPVHSEVADYFRLSGLYQEVFAGQPPSFANVAADYVRAFGSESQRVTYLAPVQFVSFAAQSLDCGAFQIRRFPRDEFDALLRNATRRLFYPRAYVDSEQIGDCWYVCVSEEKPRARPGMLTIRFRPEWNARAASPEFDRSVLRALQCLSLYHWPATSGSPTGERIHVILVAGKALLARPRIPLVIASSDSPIECPEPCPDLSMLGLRGVAGPFEYQQEAEPQFRFDATQTDQFAAFMRDVSALIAKLDGVGQKWAFVQKALEFLWAGFSCEGMEQLLRNVTAIEAVFGEKVQAGLTRLLRDRLSAILGSTQAEQKRVRKRFDDLYDLRSDYIHGNVGQPGAIDPRALVDAREFARAAVLWMIRYLGHVYDHLRGEAVPDRETVLRTLDLDSARRRDLAGVISSLPDSFPRVDAWIR
ncbi:MAG: hypothetical protein AAB403_18270 [Planctomycetota bacterium]